MSSHEYKLEVHEMRIPNLLHSPEDAKRQLAVAGLIFVVRACRTTTTTNYAQHHITLHLDQIDIEIEVSLWSGLYPTDRGPFVRSTHGPLPLREALLLRQETSTETRKLCYIG